MCWEKSHEVRGKTGVGVLAERTKVEKRVPGGGGVVSLC